MVEANIMAQLVQEGWIEAVGVQVNHKAGRADPAEARPCDALAARNDDAVEEEVQRAEASLVLASGDGECVERVGYRVVRIPPERSVFKAAAACVREARYAHGRHDCRLEPEAAPRRLVEKGIGKLDGRLQVVDDATIRIDQAACKDRCPVVAALVLGHGGDD